MKNIDLGQTIQTLANIGVIAGIVFLIFELRQNNAALESQSRMSHAEGRSEYFNRLSTDPVLMPIMVKARLGQPLDAVEEARLIAHYVAMFISWQWEWEESERGRLELPATAWQSAFAAGNTSPGNSSFALRAWEQNHQMLQPGFVAYIESEILDSGP
jgi:hypothetical protein